MRTEVDSLWVVHAVEGVDVKGFTLQEKETAGVLEWQLTDQEVTEVKTRGRGWFCSVSTEDGSSLFCLDP